MIAKTRPKKQIKGKIGIGLAMRRAAEGRTEVRRKAHEGMSGAHHGAPSEPVA
jgi:hypothetical protein